MVQTGFGGPEVCVLRDVPEPACGPGDVVVRVAACGLNRLDLIQRTGPGVIPGFALPHVAGMDVAGTVVAAGADVTALAPGDRVVADPTQGCGTCPQCSVGDRPYCVQPRIVGGNIDGGLAEYVRVSAESAVRVPEAMTLREAATLPTAWATAWHCVNTVAGLAAGETFVVHAAASAVSLAAITLAKRAGATVVAAASTPEKLEAARRAGADVAVDNAEPLAKVVAEHTDGRGAEVVLDHVGAATWRASLDSLAVRGRLVMLGNTTGDGVQFSLAEVFHRELKLLGAGGYTSADFLAATAACFAGGLSLPVAEVLPLEELAPAWDVFERRSTVGKVVIEP
ncbi:alcohol dehydrogenase catalytic domain-containing protein [Jatrophihabitans fulvus]